MNHTMIQAVAARPVPRRLGRWARRMLLDRHAELWLSTLNRAASLSELRARVVEVIDETADTRTFVLQPNHLWIGHRAGQFTTVSVELDGVRVRRCYSVSSAPGQAPAITVKRVPGGRVSGWLHDHARPGSVIGLSPAAGDFVLEADPGEPLLLYSGGSGITPVMSILRDLSARDAVGDVVFVHHARSAADVIFAAELRRLAARHRGLRLELRLDDAGGRFDPSWLATAVPDFAARRTLLCGPPGLMALIEAAWQQAGAGGRLQRERFTAAVPPASTDPADPVTLQLIHAGRRVSAVASKPLLEQLEQSGERPAHGCRIGICQTCRCRKRSGTVRNLLTGQTSSEPDEDIRLCVSAPLSDLELAL
jgi:stearoyl-CoA 9-desaturase NADPH oxidoreductase